MKALIMKAPIISATTIITRLASSYCYSTKEIKQELDLLKTFLTTGEEIELLFLHDDSMQCEFLKNNETFPEYLKTLEVLTTEEQSICKLYINTK